MTHDDIWGGGRMRQEGSLIFNFSERQFARNMSHERVCDLIRQESEKIPDTRIRYLYVVRALLDVGDSRGRSLTDEELAVLDKTVRKDRLGQNDLALLEQNKAQYERDPFEN